LGRLAEARPSLKGKPPATDAGGTRPAPPSRWSGGVVSGVIGTVVLAVWKFKVFALLLLTKGKLLLLGLTKASTFFSMLATVGIYWTQFGGWLALGFVLSVYIHEMGHVFVLMRYGVRATAPLFVPGLGAFIRLKQPLVDPRQDARVGLGGPIWGTGAALACAGIFLLTRQPIWMAIARLGAFVNLFNLIPVWQLDGAHAFRSLNRAQRWLAVASITTAWAVTDNPVLGLWLIILLVFGVIHTLTTKPSDKPDVPILAQYALLVMILSSLIQVPVALAKGQDILAAIAPLLRYSGA
jgi:Zn-dependent protease